MTLTTTRQKNMEKKLINLVNRFNRKGLGFLRKNEKTIISMDKYNLCPREKEEKPCAYCYKGDLYKRFGKTGFEKGRPYHCSNSFNTDTLRGFCREYRQIMKQYNQNFSIRLFSMGDYMPDDKSFWRTVLRIMKEEKVRVHAITKQYFLIADIADLLNCINLSVDTLHPENSLDRALEAKKTLELTTRVKIRCMAYNAENTDYFADKVDIITIYHGNNLSRTMPDLKTYTAKGKDYRELINNIDNGKVCCTKDGKCTNCKRCQ